LENLLVLPLAVLIDIVIGEYPARLHPVVWMGGVISLLLKVAPKKNNAVKFIYGLFIVLFTIALFGLPVYFLLVYLKAFSVILYIVMAAVILKSCFSGKALDVTVRRVRDLLLKDRIEAARQEISYLVSRDTLSLNRRQITSAAVEVTAESVTDSIVSPLFYWLLLGVPGAVAYRVVNTFDARIGYHGEYEYLGKFAARLDDILNYVPARISGVIMIISACPAKMNARRSWSIVLRDHAKTESPNAGWTMAAVAGALGVQLEKPGYYILGDDVSPLSVTSISGSLKLMWYSFFIWFVLCMIITGVWYAVTT
jgi:adenosylcobinamide-phosphate synthase